MHLPASFPRRLTGAAAIACAAALVPAAALAATSSPAASTPRCTTAGLVVWLDVPPGDDYAGGAAYYLEFTNLSGHACTLRGYPGVSAVSLNGRQLGSPAGWGTPATTTVRLANGATATADLQITDPGGYGNRCLLPPPWAAAMAARDAAHRGRPARIPAKPVRVESDPVPIPGMPARRTGLHPRRAGNARRSSQLIPRSCQRQACRVPGRSWPPAAGPQPANSLIT